MSKRKDAAEARRNIRNAEQQIRTKSRWIRMSEGDDKARDEAALRAAQDFLAKNRSWLDRLPSEDD